MKTIHPSGHIEYTDESGFEEGIERAVKISFGKFIAIRFLVCLIAAILFVLGASYAIASNSQMFYWR